MFIILPGDNDRTRCVGVDKTWDGWTGNFRAFEKQKWNVKDWAVKRPQQIPVRSGASANFAFLRKEVLFVCVNIVGGTVRNTTEWSERHDFDYRWVLRHLNMYSEEARAVVLFGQAIPKLKHVDFFIPLKKKLKKFGFNEQNLCTIMVRIRVCFYFIMYHSSTSINSSLVLLIL